MKKRTECKITKKEIIILAVLTLITTLEPFCIDSYISSFGDISQALKATQAQVQISLSVFLGGFAVGQLVWGIASDAFGRRLPILISLVLFTVSSVLCGNARSIEFLWVMRFFQAFFGCAPVVISRAVVTDAFDPKRILWAFSILAITQCFAPMAGPAVGNAVREAFSWREVFLAAAALGAVSFGVALFFLRETHLNRIKSANPLGMYWSLLKDKKFMSANVAGCAVYAALMMYISNSSPIFMKKFGMDGTMFSGLFIANSVAILLGSVLISRMSGRNKSVHYLKISFALLLATAVAFFLAAEVAENMWLSEAALFAMTGVLGALFPLSTNLALKPFAASEKSGTASAVFGFLQLGAAFAITAALNGLSDNACLILAGSLALCALAGYAPYFNKSDPAPETITTFPQR